ncbi:MAG: sulfatase, partial [Acidimicrobiia bacterium]
LDWPGTRSWDGPWTHLGVFFSSPADEGAVTLDILSVRVIPRETEFAGDRAGVRMVGRNNAHRRTLYTHAPGRLDYHVKVPDAGRLDVGLGVLLDNAPVTFTITAQRKSGEAETLLKETYADQDQWAQRSVDLSHLAGQTVTLALEAEAARTGTVALWAAPTISGARTTEVPNVVFYIIDGAGADYMSVYGYNRRTTPNLERLAVEGAVFENAYSNSTWSKPSTASFMTSLQHSVLGGHRSDADPVPDEAVTMAEHMHAADYQTGVFASNPLAGSLSNLERGVDVFRDAGVEINSASSAQLHEDFWNWREAYPGEPYWVHFQTTDVHPPHNPVSPFAGLFVDPQRRETFHEWGRQVDEAGGGGYPYSDAFEKTGISRLAYFDAARSLYDETMAHQDYQIGQLVERLKARGEWEHTLFIVAADHGHPAATSHFGLGLLEPQPPIWEGAMLSDFQTHIPLIVIWPEKIALAQRLDQHVSMVDMLPTILDLVGLPMPEILMGQSLAPLMLGQEGWEPRPVILDEFEVDRATGELSGVIEVIDGRWGASLYVNPNLEGEELPLRGHRDSPIPGSKAWENKPEKYPLLLLYDLWKDPYTQHSLHEERPDLVEKYTEFLEAQFEAHQALAKLFTRSGEVALTPEQLETLRALGYIQ